MQALVIQSPSMRKTPKTPISVRLPADLEAALQAATKETLRPDGKPADRTWIIEQALRSYLGLLSGGAEFLTDEERWLVSRLRDLLTRNPGVREMVFDVVRVADEGPLGLKAVEHLGGALEAMKSAVEALQQRPEERGKASPGTKDR